MDHYELYKDIQVRTNGEIYIGVVGPVRTGKSTFIKRFMDVLVLPHLEDENVKARTVDELPQSASGRTIMTTEPKFVPKEAAKIDLTEDVSGESAASGSSTVWATWWRGRRDTRRRGRSGR